VNEAGDRGRGLNLELSARTAAGWSARGSYTAEQTRQKRTKAPVINSPHTLAKLNGTEPLPVLGRLGMELLYTAPQQSYLGTRVASSFLANATVSASTRSGWYFSAGCYNLLNTRWSTPTGPEIRGPATDMKRISINSLTFNITGIVLLASSVALGTYAATLLLLDRRSSIAALDGQLVTLADVIGQNSTTSIAFDDRPAAGQVLEALRHDDPIVSGCLYDLSGSLFAEYRRDVGGPSCSPRVELQPGYAAGYRRVSRAVYRRSERVGTIVLASDLQALVRREHSMIQLAGLLALVSLVLGLASGLILERRITRPIFALAEAMRSVCSGEVFAGYVEPRGSEEIRALGNGFNRMIAELQRRDQRTRDAEATLRQEARRDSLTGLPNRRAFMERFADALTAADRNDTLVGLLYIDLDGFKLVNDSLGHSAGDKLLKRVAARLSSRIRVSDTLARVGGDEFTLILPGLKVKDDAGYVAKSLLEALQAPFKINDRDITIGCSIGISPLPTALWKATTCCGRPIARCTPPSAGDEIRRSISARNLGSWHARG
jgi:diguanylate cyclase (GGDEF)-like protein